MSGTGITGCLHIEECKQILSITVHETQIQFTKDHNIKPDALNLTEEKMGNSLEHSDTGNNFLNKILVAQALRQIINETV